MKSELLASMFRGTKPQRTWSGPKQQTTAHEIFVPDRKISETLLDFGDPLLSMFDGDPPLETMQNLHKPGFQRGKNSRAEVG